MIIYANADGAVQSSPSFLPSGSGGIPVQVVAPDYAGWTCSVAVTPPSMLIIDPVILTPSFGGDRGVWTGRMPPGTASKPGGGTYQLQFVSADGQTVATLSGTYYVQRGVVDAYPEDMSDLSSYSLKMLAVLLSQFANKYNEFATRLEDLENGSGSVPDNVVTTDTLKDDIQGIEGYEMKLIKNVLSWGISGKVLASVVLVGLSTLTSCFWTQTNRDNLATMLESVPIVAETETEAEAINTVRESLTTALRESVPDEPEYVYITFALDGVTASIGGQTYESGIAPVERGKSVSITFTPKADNISARPADGATITAPAGYTGENGAADGVYVIKFAPTADASVSCVGAVIKSPEVLAGIEVNHCTLPANGATGVYDVYLGSGSPIATYGDMRDYMSVRAIYKRDGVQTRTEELTDYTIANSEDYISVSGLYAIVTVRYGKFSATILLNEVSKYTMSGAVFYLDGEVLEGSTVSLPVGKIFKSLISSGRLKVKTISDMFGTRWAKREWSDIFKSEVNIAGKYSEVESVQSYDGYTPSCRFSFGNPLTTVNTASATFTLKPVAPFSTVTVTQSGDGFSIEELSGSTSGTVEISNGLLELVVNVASGYTSSGVFTVTKNGETLTAGTGYLVTGNDIDGYALSVSGCTDGDNVTVHLSTTPAQGDNIRFENGVLTILALAKAPTQTTDGILHIV